MGRPFYPITGSQVIGGTYFASIYPRAAYHTVPVP